MATAKTDPKLREKIENLMLLLRLTQDQFSRQLGVSRPQVSRWLKGTELPSNEKLIMLGNIAATVISHPDSLLRSDEKVLPMETFERLQALAVFPDSHWFWEKASVNLDLIRDSLQSNILAKADQLAVAKPVAVSGVNAKALMQEFTGAKASEIELLDSVPFPALFISEPKLVNYVQVTDRVAGSPYTAGDLVLVRRWEGI